MEAAPNSKLHVIQRRLHNSKFALKNHLLSIHQDASFVECLSSLFPALPIIANLRNGSSFNILDVALTDSVMFCRAVVHRAE